MILIDYSKQLFKWDALSTIKFSLFRNRVVKFKMLCNNLAKQTHWISMYASSPISHSSSNARRLTFNFDYLSLHVIFYRWQFILCIVGDSHMRTISAVSHFFFCGVSFFIVAIGFYSFQFFSPLKYKLNESKIVHINSACSFVEIPNKSNLCRDSLKETRI